MSRPSVKRRLIAALEADRKRLADGDGLAALIDGELRLLRARGSGPLPAWLRAEARARGIK